jgi:hypothetical protein
MNENPVFLRRALRFIRFDGGYFYSLVSGRSVLDAFRAVDFAWLCSWHYVVFISGRIPIGATHLDEFLYQV